MSEVGEINVAAYMKEDNIEVLCGATAVPACCACLNPSQPIGLAPWG